MATLAPGDSPNTSTSKTLEADAEAVSQQGQVPSEEGLERAKAHSETEIESGSNEWEDLLGSGAVLKKVLQQGFGEVGEFNQNVDVHFEMRLPGQSDPFRNTRKENDGKPVRVKIGDNVLDLVVPGLMLAIRMMKPKEIAEVKISHRFAYADDGLEPHVPPNTDIIVRVECIHVGDFAKEAADMSLTELLDAIQAIKERGNYFFGIKNTVKALQCYTDAVKKSEAHLPAPKEGEEEVPIEPNEYTTSTELHQLRVACTSNIAACFERQGKWKEAKETCVVALGMDPRNTKVLLRAARVATQQGEFKEAKACLKRAREVNGDPAIIAKHAADLKKKIQAYNATQRARFGGFLDQDASKTKSEGSQDTIKLDKVVKGSTSALNEVKESATDLRAPLLDTKQAPQRSVKRPVPWTEVVFRLLVLLAPTIAAFIMFSQVPMAKGAKSWAHLPNDAAQHELNQVGYATLVCEGRYQRASCCVCLSAMRQVELRQRTITSKAKVKSVQVGFRMDAPKEKVPIERSELAVMDMLDRVCSRLPVDIPKSENDLDRAKRFVSRGCTKLIDRFYDSFLSRIVSGEPEPQVIPMPRAICSQVAEVCENREHWSARLLSFGPLHTELPCDFCLAVVDLVATKRPTPKELLSPSSICAQLKLGIAKSEERVAELSAAIGDACIEFLYDHRSKLATEDQGGSQLELASDYEQAAQALRTELCEPACQNIRNFQHELPV